MTKTRKEIYREYLVFYRTVKIAAQPPCLPTPGRISAALSFGPSSVSRRMANAPFLFVLITTYCRKTKW